MAVNTDVRLRTESIATFTRIPSLTEFSTITVFKHVKNQSSFLFFFFNKSLNPRAMLTTSLGIIQQHSSNNGIRPTMKIFMADIGPVK